MNRQTAYKPRFAIPAVDQDKPIEWLVLGFITGIGLTLIVLAVLTWLQ